MAGIFNAAIFNNAVFNTGVVETPTIPQGGGGYHPSQGYRTERDISRARRRLGLKDKVALAEDIIADVAARQAERLEQDRHKQFEELQRELEIEEILLDASHIEALNNAREALIDAELKVHFRRLQEQEELEMLILVATSI